MSYQVIFDPGALREFDKLPKAQQRRVGRGIDELAKDPRRAGVEKMTEVEAYKLRIGDFRVIYAIKDEVLLVLVVKIGNRRDVYKDLGIIRSRLSK